MSLSNRILRRIRKHFMDNDFQFLEQGETPNEFIFSSDKETALVKILFEDEADREALTRALTSVVKKASSYNRVYIAIPAWMHKAGLDTSTFTENGVGLIVYDDYDANEEVPAESRVKSSKKVQLFETRLPDKNLIRIESLLRDLSERVDSLEKAYLSLLREVRELRRLLERRTLVEEKITRQHVEAEVPQETGVLPSFLRDNPWVEILSKRSEEPY